MYGVPGAGPETRDSGAGVGLYTCKSVAIAAGRINGPEISALPRTKSACLEVINETVKRMSNFGSELHIGLMLGNDPLKILIP